MAGAHDTHAAHAGHDHTPRGWRRFAYSTNHKDIGTMYLIFAIVAGLVGAFLSVMMRAELMYPGMQIFADPHTFRLFKLENTPAILVGMDVLRMFDQVAIDFSRQEVRFNISQSWNPRTLQALNRPKTEGTDDGSARLLARADPAGAGVDTGGNLFRHQERCDGRLQPDPRAIGQTDQI